MSVNAKIEAALKGLAESINPMVCPDESPPEEYIVYNPEVVRPDDFGDNCANEWVAYMQVHYFCRGNYLKKERQIRKALLAAGFSISESVTIYDRESKYNHTCISCSMEESED